MVRTLGVLFGLLVFEPGLERLDVHRRSWCIGELAEAEKGEGVVADDVDGGETGPGDVLESLLLLVLSKVV